jgi:Tfp pilus assembly PilM family ATPase
LSRLKEITSTEKLLDFIRNKKSEAPVPPSKPTRLVPPLRLFQTFSGKFKPQTKAVTVGVDIGHESLRLVKTIKKDDSTWELLDYRSVPFSHISSRKSPEFVNFLRSEMSAFCGECRDMNLWAIMSAAKVNVRHIRIPKVAKKQIENAVYWTIKKETPFDEKDTIFDFEIQQEVTEQSVKKWLVMVYTAPREEVNEISKLFSQVGLHLTGISITPFAFQNIFNTGWIPAADGSIASLFIGNDFSRIDIYDQGKLVMTRGIKAGINSMVELLMEKLMVLRRDKAAVATIVPLITVEEVKRVLFTLSPDAPPLTEGETGYELTEEEKFNVILPALERVVRQVDRTFEHYTVHLTNKKVRRIYVSTAMNLYRPFVEYVGEQLGVESDVLDPLNLQFQASDGKFQRTSISERVASIPALGLAFSDNNYTPNLLFRFKDKEKALQTVRINRIASMVMIAAIMVSFVFLLYQVQAAYQKEAAITKLESQLLQYHPRVDRNIVAQIAAGAKDEQQMKRAYGERYLGMAVISELAALTPSNIRLINVKANLAGAASVKAGESSKDAAKEPAKGTGKDAAGIVPRSVVIEGVIFGDRKLLDSMLAGYVTKLETSPIFRLINVQKNSVEPFKKNDVLHFILDVKIG